MRAGLLFLLFLSLTLVGCDKDTVGKLTGGDKSAKSLGARADGGDTSSNSALVTLAKKAQEQDPHAALQLGYLYQTGENNVPVNYLKAAAAYNISIHGGIKAASHNLGLMFLHGQGTQQNIPKAIQHFEDAAGTDGTGLSVSMMQLGRIYEQGYGVPQNMGKAAYWYERAANKDDGLAQYKIGIALLEGNGKSKNYNHAMQWLTKSAKNGRADAMFVLGKIYIEGQTLQQNVTLGGQWLIAASQTNQGYERHIGAYLQRLTPAEFNAAKNMARAWLLANQKSAPDIDYEKPVK